MVLLKIAGSVLVVDPNPSLKERRLDLKKAGGVWLSSDANMWAIQERLGMWKF